jgi:tetratricopeptide (TPR) repeat protein
MNTNTRKASTKANRTRKPAGGKTRKPTGGKTRKLANAKTSKLANAKTSKLANAKTNKLANAKTRTLANGKSNKLADGKKQWRRGNVIEARRLLEESLGSSDGPMASSYLGVLKGTLGYVHRHENHPQWPSSADEDFARALREFSPDSVLWKAWSLAQQGEARRAYVGGRFVVLPEEDFQRHIDETVTTFNQALELLGKDEGAQARQMRSWIFAHRAATHALACLLFHEHDQATRAQASYDKATQDFAQARALSKTYSWVSSFEAFLTGLRPEIFPDSGETAAEASARSARGFQEALATSTDIRQRLRQVADMLAGQRPEQQKPARELLQSTLKGVNKVQQSLEVALKQLGQGNATEASLTIEGLLAAELSGGNRVIFRSMAGMAFYGEQYDEAIRCGLQALQEDPFDGVARYFVAASLLKKGDSLGQPVGDSMHLEMINQLELLLGMAMHLSVMTSGDANGGDLRSRLAKAAQVIQQAQAPANGPPGELDDEKLKHIAMKALDALMERAHERRRNHFEFTLFKNLKK